MNYRKEIERLYMLEYGRRGEVALRQVTLWAGATILHEYTGWAAAFWWVGGIALGHVIYFATLRVLLKRGGRRGFVLAGVIFLGLAAAFMWMPAILLAQSDKALMISGAALFGVGLVYLIYRADTALALVQGEIAVVVAMICLTLSQMIGQVHDPLARGGTLFAVAALAIYFAATLFKARRARLEFEAAAARSVQAQKMKAIGQLAGGVAHDFNNILTAVIGNLELYEAVPDPAERDRFVAESRAAAERAARLVQQLLAYSRKSTMSIAVHQTAALIEEVRMLTRRLIPSSIEVTIAAEDPLPIAVDQAQFMTALVNLVVNARDAMPAGGRIEITAQEVVLDLPLVQPDGYQIAPGRYARIELADTGTGIAPEILRRVTEPFFTTKPVGQGSGLGLSMVEGFARQSHGALALSSGGQGTRAVIYLPLVTHPGAAAVQSAADPAVTPSALRGLTTL